MLIVPSKNKFNLRPSALMPTIACRNETSDISDAELAEALNAIQHQITNDFAPVWGTPALLTMLSAGQNFPEGSWPLHVVDYTQVFYALGYHTKDYGKNIPWGDVGVKSSQENGQSWTVTLSHEIMEMIGNPYVDLWHNYISWEYIDPSPLVGYLTGYLAWHEMSDPCEFDGFGYTINGVLVSDFLYPSYFNPDVDGTVTKFDHTECLTGFGDIAYGGYFGFQQILVAENVYYENASLFQKLTGAAAEKMMNSKAMNETKNVSNRNRIAKRNSIILPT
jgi:hypothetical protein